MSEPEKYAHAYRVPYTASTVGGVSPQGIINCNWFAWYLSGLGWTKNAICAALGNWEVETYLNPNFPQSRNFPNDNLGFGMPHWTPWPDKIGKWAFEKYGLVPTATDDNPLADFALQMEFHEYDCQPDLPGGRHWYANGGYSYAWKNWKVSTDDVQELCRAYYYQYERSGAGDPGNRPERAQKWFDYFTLHPYPTQFPVWLLFKFNRRW